MTGHLTIVPAEPEQAEALAALAKPIWEEHFTPIIGREQVAYMLEKFQSARAVREQMERDGYRYFFLMWDGVPVGYTGVKPESDALFLSKLYVKKEFRGRGIARAAVDFLSELCRGEHLARIRLTCNKYNAGSLAAYRAMDFTVVRAQVSDIGGGFAMDDYVLEKSVRQRIPSAEDGDHDSGKEGTEK